MTPIVSTPGVRTPLIPPSTHPYAEVIHRLEAGGSMLPDTPENLQQIIGIYKAYAVPMDFYWRDLLYIAERVFLNPLPAFKYFISKEYLDLPNSYSGDQSKLRIWRGGEKAHPELLEGTTKNTGLPWKYRLRLMSRPASALANGRGKADFSWCPGVYGAG